MSLMKRLFPRFNVFIYKLTNGKLGARASTSTVLLLYTKGRKTGKERTITGYKSCRKECSLGLMIESVPTDL